MQNLIQFNIKIQYKKDQCKKPFTFPSQIKNWNKKKKEEEEKAHKRFPKSPQQLFNEPQQQLDPQACDNLSPT